MAMNHSPSWQVSAGALMSAESRARWPETMIHQGRRLTLTCWSCKHAKDVDLLALVASGKGQTDVEQIRFRCRCGKAWPSVTIDPPVSGLLGRL